MPLDYKRGNTTQVPDLVANYIPRVIVKFRETENRATTLDERALIRKTEIARYKSIEQNPARYLGDSWRTLVAQHPGLIIQKLITSVSSQQIIKLREKVSGPNPPPNFLAYFAVRCPSTESAGQVAESLRNHQLWPNVEGAYVEGQPSRPPTVFLTVSLSSNEAINQGHLNPSPANGGKPGGIDAKHAWGFPGGDGGGAQVGLQFVDLEWGWVLDHEDLPKDKRKIRRPVSGENILEQGHGTCALGVVAAVENNNKECVGITPHVNTVKVVSPWVWSNNTWTYSVANAIMAALNGLNPGDVLLLEVQTLPSSYRRYDPNWAGFGFPVEVEEAEFKAIRHASGLGIIVIEAAGNAGVDLDPLVFNTWTTTQFSLNPNDGQFQDSGAIMVGSALAAVGQPRTPNNNYGLRIDCYAWDNGIWTTGYDDGAAAPPAPRKSYIGFSGTSGASAIIAGATLAIQGIAQQHQKGDHANGRFSPNGLRAILRDPATGTRSANGAADKIGVMPDLRKIIKVKLGLP